MKKKFAIGRPPSKSYVTAINDWYAKGNYNTNRTINYHEAIKQHKQYVNSLKKMMIGVVELPADESYPDGCFVQDPVLICENEFLITNQFAPSRRGEYKQIAKKLTQFGLKSYKMTAGFCDGGDVMVTGDIKKAWVGISKRTNTPGFEIVKSFYNRHGYEVYSVPVSKCLHLLTGISYLGDKIFLVSALADEKIKQFQKKYHLEMLKVPNHENYAVNVISYNKIILMPQGFFGTERTLKSYGYKVLKTPMDEFEKADGGITCLSLIFDC
ncbi:hypothetical protein HY214_04285 [Candidatus Roizmanbacteria bacterium]|nr:hypothetical protein [Candidatus Roizmanbacteria bacterium]